MKKYINIILVAAILFAYTPTTFSQECNLPISVVSYPQNDELPQAVESALENQLSRIITAHGMEPGISLGQFIITARIDVTDKSIHQGPPIQVVYDLGITMYIADTYTQTKFASEYIEVNGVGNNETKSLMNAIKRLNANNNKIASFIKNGKNKILNYFDSNYAAILKEAERKASMQMYDEAIALAASIPACSKGGDAATDVMLEIYNKSLDKYNRMLLDKAAAAWATGQTDAEAVEAGKLLSLIDPEAACYPEAKKLLAEIKSQVRKDIDFEMREKYHDDVKLEKQRIDAIREIGVAFGKGQKEQTTNLTWLK